MRAPLGILFVHGIGEQQPGSSIAESGEALAEWLDSWYRGAGVWHRSNGLSEEKIATLLATLEPSMAKDPALRQSVNSFLNPLREIRTTQQRVTPGPHPKTNWLGGSCALSSVLLDPPVAEPRIPAHGRLTLTRIALNGKFSQHEIQLAEAYWADAFPIPDYGEFFTWAAQYLPLILQAHLGWGLYQARAGESKKWPARIRRWVDVAGWYVLAVLLPAFSIPILALLLLGLVVSQIPISAVRDGASAIREVVSNILGDCYVLLERPARAAAIRRRVLESLTWLARESEKIIVVAHSQGAAIAFDLLSEHAVPAQTPICRLITLGSAARPLAHMRYVRMGASVYGSWGSAWCAVLFAVLAGLVSYDVSRGREHWPSLISMAIFVVGGGIFLWSRWRHGSADHLQESKEWKRSLQGLDLPWDDFPASVDPVSNGSHVVNKKGNTRPPSLETHEVQNRGSLLADHTSYWDNPHQFVARVAEIVSDELVAAPLKNLTPFDRATLDYAWFARNFRVSCLRLGRMVVWFALVHVVLGGSGYLQATGNRVIRDASKLDLEMPAWVARMANFLLDLNFGRGRDWMAGMLSFLVVAVLGQALWTLAWKTADRRMATRMFRRNADPVLGHDEIPPELILFGYVAFYVFSAWRFFFRYVPVPGLLSLESSILLLLVLLHLSDVAACVRFLGRSLAKIGRNNNRPPTP